MSLLVTVVCPDGIVMGVDSALTTSEGGDVLTLSSFPKVLPIPKLNSGLSFAGAANFGSSWISTWLKDFIGKVAVTDSLSAFAEELVTTLNETKHDPDQRSVIHFGGWVLLKAGEGPVMAPRMYSINTDADGRYRWKSMISDDDVSAMLAWRQDTSKPYPLLILSDGKPKEFATWIQSTATEEFKKLMKRPVPFPHITAVAEYVRFLIRMIAELHRISREHAFVSEPIETLLIFPENKNMMSLRY